VQPETENPRIILDILESVDRDSERTQRSRASEIGIALGLTNAYLKFCIHKGYLKARKTSARTYRYMLTPKGFAEKSRLTLSRLANSLEFLRATRAEYSDLFTEAGRRNWRKMVIVSASSLAEVCTLCALEHGIVVVAIVDREVDEGRLLGVPLRRSFDRLDVGFDGAVIADLQEPIQTLAWTESAIGAQRVLIPKFLDNRGIQTMAAQ
jgi:predicted transcriptional regulator